MGPDDVRDLIFSRTCIESEHDAILASIAAGFPDAAAQAMSDHLTKALDRILRTVGAPPDSRSGQDPANADQ